MSAIDPTTGVFTIDFLNSHLVIGHTLDDELLAVYQDAAVEYCEGICSSALISKARIRRFEDFNDDLCLGMNVTSVESVTYRDVEGNTQTLDPAKYELHCPCGTWHIRPIYGEIFPEGDSVEINYTAGFSELPPAVGQAILLCVGHFYQNREAMTPLAAAKDIPHSVTALLRPYTVGILS